MNKVFAAIVLALVCTVGAAAQDSADTAKLMLMLDEFLIGASQNNAVVHDRFWADDLIYTRSAGVRINKDELMKSVRSAPVRKPDDPKVVYKAEDVTIHQYGDAAVVAFRLVATTTKAGSTEVSNYLNTGTFIRRNGQWRVVAWQSTVMAKTPEK
jgi:hypothetical protein